MNKRLALALFAVLAGSLFAMSLALAQGTAAINRWVISGGGGPSSGGNVTFNDTLGQPIVGPSSSGNVWLGAGYWGGARATHARLTVNKSGDGTVVSDPPGVFCGADCTEVYDLEHIHTLVVTLTAHPAVKSYFVGWGGDCSGTEQTIQLTLDADKTCTATFGYPIGGIIVPVDKLGLLAPWIGVVTLVGLAAFGVALVRRQLG
jgi:hypothetical protein